MNLAEYARHDATALAELVRNREVKAKELAELAYEAISLVNGDLNAVIEETRNEALRTLSEGAPAGPFEGVPFLVKDVGMHYAGVPSEMGSRLLKGVSMPTDSELAARCKRAGLVLVGRTNIPELGANASTEPVLNGPTHNPWNLANSPGGSSGGAAAAVAAGITPIAHANDGGGSIRIPAGLCGLFGLKPTRGRHPWGPDVDEGIFGLGVEHVVTRTVRDSAAFLDAVHGSDIGARYLLQKPDISFLEASRRDPRRLKIAFCVDSPDGAQPVDSVCRQAVLDTAKFCEELGHDVFEAKPDIAFEESCAIFRDVGAPGIAAGMLAASAQLARPINADTVEPTSRALIRRGQEMSAIDFAGAFALMNNVSRRLGHFFTSCDIWLTPVITLPVLPLGRLNAQDESLDAAGWVRKIMEITPFTAMFNGSGQPAMSVPVQWTADGQPIGMHFVARFAEETTLFSLAGQIERARPWIGRTPPHGVLGRMG
ncbi:MAG: amidase [Parvularculaceae bacterium]